MIDYKFDIHTAVMYEGKIARVEDRAVKENGNEVYLIQTANHRYYWVDETELEEYVG